MRKARKPKVVAKKKRAARPKPPIGRDQKQLALQLNTWANKLEGAPFGVDHALAKRFASRSPRLDFMDESERSRIAEFLRSLVARPAVLKAIHNARTEQGAGAPVKNGARDWNVTLDYELTYERHRKAAAAEKEIMDAWGFNTASAMHKAMRPCKLHAGWVWWKNMFRQQEAALLHNKKANMSRYELSREISLKLRGST